MSLYKRKDSSVWWVKLSHKGCRLQESTGTADRKEAQEYHDKRKHELWEQQRLGVKPRHFWEEAVLRHLAESGHKATLETDKYHLRWMQPHLEGMSLDDISREVIDKLFQAGLSEGVSNATVNRRLELLRSILRKAVHDWEWMDRMPKMHFLKEPLGRIRWLRKEEAVRLLEELPEHLRAMARFSLATGLRQGNVKRLRWAQVDLGKHRAWIQAHEAKGRRAIPVPLNTEAMDVLLRQQGQHPVYVFSYKGKPIEQVGTKAWRGALDRAGIADFHWHDLRHTWASWHVQNGTPLNVLQELGGWRDASMVQRYAHLAMEHLESYAETYAERAELSSLTAGYVLATVKEVAAERLRVTH
ncbi:MAG: site-specific integrase [Nevskiaceae bacterium]|nr:MAG: site-specific integrase [Nevskiaceae bacterium]TBR74586.1 MAG: site-specific integrase [Nevskiaceae bacterium]